MKKVVSIDNENLIPNADFDDLNYYKINDLYFEKYNQRVIFDRILELESQKICYF